MSRPDAIPAANDPPPADSPAEGRGLILRQIGRLDRLADIGMEMAEIALQSAKAQSQGGGAGADGPDPGLTFTRVARAVRLTLALQSRLAKTLDGLDNVAALERTVEAARRRERIHDRVERVIETDLDDEDAIERLSACAWERLEDADDADIANAPVAEVVARICRDLGIEAHDLLSPSREAGPGVGVWSAIGSAGGARGAAAPSRFDGVAGSPPSPTLPPSGRKGASPPPI